MPAIKIQEGCTLISVWDMPTAVQFYRDLLGFELTERSPTYAVEDGEELFHWCMMRSAEAWIMLNTEYDEGERPAERPAKVDERFGAWFFYGCADVDGAYETLKAAGVDCEPPKLTMYGGIHAFRTLSIRDPDGHGITLQRRVEPTG